MQGPLEVSPCTVGRRFRLLAHIGVGEDGHAYRALDRESGLAVVLHRLMHARGDAVRMQAIRQRLALLRQLRGVGVCEIAEEQLEDDPPLVATAAGGESLSSLLAESRFDIATVVKLGRDVAAALAKAHRFDVVHGGLCPSALLLDDGVPKIDLCGLKTAAYGLPTAADRWCVGIDEPPSRALDLRSLSRVLRCALLGRAPTNEEEGLAAVDDDDLADLLRAMDDDDPASRPETDEVLLALSRAASEVQVAPPPSVTAVTVAHDQPPSPPDGSAGVVMSRLQDTQPGSRPPLEQVGRFRLHEVIGRGGMGVVCRAQDIADGLTVAIKLLLEDWRDPDTSLLRFKKEVRLLAGLQSPYIARLIDANVDEGVRFLALEFVNGHSLRQLIRERGRLEVAEAVAVIADVARGLGAVHDAGIVHRDIKPDNIMVVSDGQRDDPRVKLLDFGVARELSPSESLELTNAGSLVGTPLYMAPEQVLGEKAGTAADIYALGATLFHALAGRPPFLGKGSLGVLGKILSEKPPELRELAPEVDARVADVVMRCLAKDPNERYANARELLFALEQATGAEASPLEAHPTRPPTDDATQTWTFEWELRAPPEALWPYVSNTERLNRAIGLGASHFETVVEDGVGVRYGTTRRAGMKLTWKEHPYEWVEGRHMGILREFSAGPFVWLASAVDLTPSGGGTRLTHRIDVAPRGLLGRAAAAIEIGRKAKAALDAVYRRIDRLLVHDDDTDVTGRGGDDAFEPPPRLPPEAVARLARGERRLTERGVPSDVVAALCDFLRFAPAPRVARIAPRALAAQLKVDPEQLVDACLVAAHENLLLLLWDLICPKCRIPSDMAATLRALSDHGRCDVCDLNYELDLASSVELVFRAAPEIRDVDTGTYCIGSPIHSTHIIAQARLAPGERMAFDLRLPVGAYILTGRGVPWRIAFRVVDGAYEHRWDVSVRTGPLTGLARALRPPRQQIVIENDDRVERTLRVERATERDDAVTAARCASSRLFRALFPDEVLPDGQLVKVSDVSLTRVAVLDAADLFRAHAPEDVYRALVALWRDLGDVAAREGGAVTKMVADGLVCAFPDRVACARGALALSATSTQRDGIPLRLCVAAHHGPAMMVTLDDRLDHFGPTPMWCEALLKTRVHGLVFSEELSADNKVAELLRDRALATRPLAIDGRIAMQVLTDGPRSLELDVGPSSTIADKPDVGSGEDEHPASRKSEHSST